MNGTKHLIMGLWAGHSFRQLENFIASLRRTTFAGDVCLFVEDISAETVALLREHGILVERTGPTASRACLRCRAATSATLISSSAMVTNTPVDAARSCQQRLPVRSVRRAASRPDSLDTGRRRLGDCASIMERSYSLWRGGRPQPA